MKKGRAARAMEGSNGRLLLRVTVARAVLLAVVVLSLATVMLALSPAPAMLDGEELYLPILLADVIDRGFLRHGSRAVFLGDGGSWAPFLERHGVARVSAGKFREADDQSFDVVLFDGDGVELSLVDRVLKVGGVAAAFGTPESAPRQLLDNYRVVFAHRSNAVAFAVVKTAAPTTAVAAPAWPHRKLLYSVAPESKKKDALAGLEAVLLEPPQKQHRHIIRRLRPKYLPELTGDSLEGYRRRMFIDVTPARRGAGAGAAMSWFRKHYPRGKHEFELVRLDSAAAGARAEAAVGIAGWLVGNVREEDYVVVKADVEAVEEMLRRGGAVRRVDELFLDCGGAGAGKEGPVPYWQCLALYGRLRDQGVAVHQWWR